MKISLLVILNFIAIYFALRWVQSDDSFEPKITLTLTIFSLITILSLKQIIQVKKVLLEKILKAVRPKWFMVEVDRIACICYRVENSKLEYLLIRDSENNRWTIPKCIINKKLDLDQNLKILLAEEAGLDGFEIKYRNALKYYHLVSEGDEIHSVLCSIVKFQNIGVPFELSKGIDRNPTPFTFQELPNLLKDGRKFDFQREVVRLIQDANDLIIIGERNNE